jgi:hypothetical protein
MWKEGTLPRVIVVTPDADRSFYMDRKDGSQKWETAILGLLVRGGGDRTGDRSGCMRRPSSCTGSNTIIESCTSTTCARRGSSGRQSARPFEGQPGFSLVGDESAQTYSPADDNAQDGGTGGTGVSKQVLNDAFNESSGRLQLN